MVKELDLPLSVGARQVADEALYLGLARWINPPLYDFAPAKSLRLQPSCAGS